MEYETTNLPAITVATNMLAAIRGPEPFDTAASTSEQTRFSSERPKFVALGSGAFLTIAWQGTKPAHRPASH